MYLYFMNRFHVQMYIYQIRQQQYYKWLDSLHKYYNRLVKEEDIKNLMEITFKYFLITFYCHWTEGTH